MTLRPWLFRPVLTALLLGPAVGVAAGLACEGQADPARREVLEHVAREVALPRFAALQEGARALAIGVGTLCASPDPGLLAAAQNAWRDAHSAWSGALPLHIGPIKDGMLANAIDFWPARPDSVEAAIADAASADAIDLGYVRGEGVAARGLPALELLLFAEADTAAALIALQDPADGGKRCAYARALAEDIADRVDDLHAAWDPGFADALAGAGHGSEVYASVQLGLDAVVNQSIEALSTMVKSKLDGPLGNLSGGAVDPETLESRFSDHGQADLLANLEGVWAVYHGADLAAEPQGVARLVIAQDPGLHDRVVAQHASARAAVEAIPRPLSTALSEHRGAVQLARDELDTLRRQLKLDVASLLGVTLSLSDNDGD